MISADNAHAVHPNHADVVDPTNRPAINEGIVIKYNANQKYTTDAVSAAVFKALCKKYRFRYRPSPTVLTLQAVPHWEISPMPMFP